MKIHSIILIAFIFSIIYAYNRRFHKAVDHFKKTVEDYEHKVEDLTTKQLRLRKHLAAKKPHMKGISHYHHSLRQLLNYIESHLNKGYSFDAIRSVLLKKGWTDEHIKQAYRFKSFR